MPRTATTSPTIDEIAALLDNKLDEKLSALENKLTESFRRELDQKLLVTDQKIATLNDRVEVLETKLAGKDGELEVMRGEINKLKDDLDDQVNRGMRNNMILKGIPEQGGGEGVREDTRELVIENLISLNPAYSHDEVNNVIDRAHRGGKTNNNNNKPRNIYIKFTTSHVVDEYVLLARKKKPNFRVEKQFSKPVTDRRNTAMMERRKLIDNKTITSGYVEFPAKLMVKYVGQTKAQLHQEF